MNDNRPNDILVYGCAYTPLYGESDTYESTLFKDNEMTSSFADQVKNLPVFIEHDTGHQIGKVHDAFINERRQLMTLLHIYGNPIVNELLPPTLSKDPTSGEGYYNALSLGNDVGLQRSEDYNLKVVNNIPSEVSLVMSGNRPMTEIEDYWLLPHQVQVHDYIEKYLPNYLRKSSRSKYW